MTTVNLTLNAAVENAVKNAFVENSIAMVKTLAEKYEFDLAEAMEMLSFDKVTVVRPGKKSSGAAVKVAKKKSERDIPTMVLPFCSVMADWCDGLRLNHSLYTQCTNAKLADGEFCRTCQTQADANANGKPKWGTVQDRLAVDLMEYVDPAGKKVVSYANVMAKDTKMGLTREAAIAEAARFGWAIPEIQFELQEKKRGRPSSKSASDAGSEDVSPKVRGRPRKEKAVGSATNIDGDDLVAAIAAGADAEADTESSPKKSPSKEVKAAEAAIRKAERDAAKAEKEAAKEAEKEAKKAEKEAEKEAKKLAAAAERDAKKQAADEAREAKKAAADAEKAAKKGGKSAPSSPSQAAAAAAPAPVVVAVAVAVPVPISELELSAEEMDDEDTETETAHEDVEDDEEEELELVTRKYKGMRFAVDPKTNKIYDMETEEVIGSWNEEAGKPELD